MADRTRLNSSLPSPRSVLFEANVHDIREFDCGNDSINEWLTLNAHHARAMGTANTYVFVRHGKVIAYYTLSAHRIQSTELPTNLSHGSPRSIPAFLIGKLGVTSSEQGKSIGASLIVDAFLRICRATNSGPSARIIAVDAIDDHAINFYKKANFKSSPLDPHQMFIKVSTALKIVTRG